MSKKIIYLLSLLMALSLVFASCKKNNGITGIQGNVNDEGDPTQTITGGLYEDWEKLKDLTIIQDYPIMGQTGGDYFRNPVVVAVGGNDVLIFAEKRVNSKGSENDIGVTGYNPVKIVYMYSKDAGDKFEGPVEIPLLSGGKELENEVSAPVVFYDKSSKKIVVAASSGVGIAANKIAYDQIQGSGNLGFGSKILVNSATITDVGNISWNGWKDISETVKNEITKEQITDPEYQFGTHSARGYLNGKDMILPVIVSKQGTTDSRKEAMGAVFLSANIDSPDNWTASGAKAVLFKVGNNNFSQYKEVRMVGGGKTDPKFYAIPSPGYNGTDKKTTFGLGTGEVGTTVIQNYEPQDSLVPGHEGSPAFLNLTDSWYGDGEYNPKTYATSPDAAGGASGAKGNSQAFVIHVTTYGGEAYMYKVNSATLKKEGNKGMRVAVTSKSSSLDVLPDGTIITAAEKDKDETQPGMKFQIYFGRYTQKYIETSFK